MKLQPLMTVKTMLCALALAVLASVPLRAQTTEFTEISEAALSALSARVNCDWLCQLRERQAQQLEGSWDVIVTPVVPPGVPQPPSFHAYGTFARGGAFIGSDRNRPASKQHGVWEHQGNNQFVYTLKEDLFDATGNFAGVLTVRVRLTVNGQNEFTGVSNGEQRDAAGNLVFNRCSTVRGTRIRIEPLAEQCRNITPPQ